VGGNTPHPTTRGWAIEQKLFCEGGGLGGYTPRRVGHQLGWGGVFWGFALTPFKKFELRALVLLAPPGGAPREKKPPTVGFPHPQNTVFTHTPPGRVVGFFPLTKPEKAKFKVARWGGSLSSFFVFPKKVAGQLVYLS